MLKINEKLIYCILAAIMLFIGICQDTTETDSLFLCANLEYANVAISSVDYLGENTEPCTSEMIGKNNSMTSLRGELGRSVVRWDRNVMLFAIVGAILQYLLYLRSTSKGEYYEILHSGTVAVDYIHHKDGEKEDYFSIIY